MAYFTTLQQFIDTVTARLTKPRRGLGGEGVLAADVLEAMKDTGKYADDMKVAAEAVNANFVARSLNLDATVYIRADTGNDSRTGVDNGATATGAVLTLDRVIALHSGKTRKLTIVLESGTLNLTADVYEIFCTEVYIRVQSGATLAFRKRAAVKDAANITVGEGISRLLVYGMILNVNVYGSLTVEAHTGSTNLGDQFYYKWKQGAMSISSNPHMTTGDEFQTVCLSQWGTVTIGANNTLFAFGTHGLNNYGSFLARYKRIYNSGTFTLGTGATESVLVGNRLIGRVNYHPTSSTDANVSEGEVLISPTNNNLYWKRGGTIYKATATAY